MIFHKRELSVVLLLLIAAAAFSQETPQTAMEVREKWIIYSKQFIGTPYKYGGLSKEGIDCSGLIYVTATEAIGLQLPRTVTALYSFARIIPDSKKEPGDLVFFKTVDARVSHVGIYMGKNQFIHAVSDGPNTGVIVSSLLENYWKNAYVGAGQVLSSPAYIAEKEAEEQKAKAIEARSQGSASDTTTAPKKTSGSSFQSFLASAPFQFDASASMNWNFFTSEEFYWNIRGGSLQIHGMYTGLKIRPGFAVEVRIDSKMGIVQIPLHITLSPSDYMRVYAGPVFTIGQPHLTGTAKPVDGSIFPGVIGISWQTPRLKLGPVGLCFVQDISYTIFNELDNSALPFLEAFSSGFLFMTGFRVVLNP